MLVCGSACNEAAHIGPVATQYVAPSKLYTATEYLGYKILGKFETSNGHPQRLVKSAF